MEHIAFFADNDRVAGIAAALITNRHINVLGKDIDELPLAFITPLSTHHHYIHQAIPYFTTMVLLTPHKKRKPVPRRPRSRRRTR